MTKELKGYGREFIAETLYFGGGTPSLMPLEYVKQFIEISRKRYSLNNNAEITLECNPENLRGIDFKILSDIGINRLSIGIQRADKSMLSLLGRSEFSFEIVSNFIKELRKYKFSLSIDFIYGIQGDSVKKSGSELRNIISAIDPEHISLYALELKPGTLFYSKYSDDSLPDDEGFSKIYHGLRKILSDSGYYQYEISNFCKNNEYSRHNMKYFDNEEYIGIGPSAWSYKDRIRYSNISDIEKYIDSIVKGHRKYDFFEKIYREKRLSETIMMKFRKNQGVELSILNEFNDKELKDWNEIKNKLIKQNILIEDKSCIRINPEYFFVSNSIISELISVF